MCQLEEMLDVSQEIKSSFTEMNESQCVSTTKFP